MFKKIYFKNLNSLRFIAALLVVIHHTEQLKSVFDISNCWSNSFIKEIGGLGVTLFFVLSGFLITYLLLSEKLETHTISIRSFYMRRILRIWPLYYLIIILGLFIIPFIQPLSLPGYTEHFYESFGEKVILFTLFVPNLALVFFAPVPFISQTWSVGVEEQFYLIWPWLVKKIKRTGLMLLIIVILYLILKAISFRFGIILQNKYISYFSEFWNGFRIDSMAIGGIAAYLLFQNKNRILVLLFNPYLQFITYIVTLTIMSFGINIPYLNSEIYSILFAIIILNLAGNASSILTLENKYFNYLGKISYGIYMYHSICIVVSIQIFSHFTISNNFFLYTLILFLTFLISTLSYEFIEKKFIKTKRKYSKIISGEEALEKKNNPYS